MPAKALCLTKVFSSEKLIYVEDNLCIQLPPIVFADSALALQSYQSSNEDALEWLLEAEEKLQGQMKKIASILDEIKLQFRSNADYMTYLETVSQAVKKVM